MPSQDYKEILSDLKKKIYRPIYFLVGEEPYFIDKITSYIEHKVLTEGEKGFNQTVVYGKDTNAKQISNIARGYPMMGNYQVVIVKEAQHIKNWDDLLSYVEKPLKSTILVLAAKQDKLDKRTKFSKAIAEHGVLMESKKMYDDKIPAWVHQHLKEEDYTISPKGAALLVEYVGNDLSRLVNELEKLMLNIPKDKEIDEADIEKNIGISKDYNSFELNKALGMKDVLKANRIVNYFASNSRANPFVLTLGSLYNYFDKLYMIYHLQHLPDKEIAAELGVHPFFMNEYKAATRNYPPTKLESVIGMLHEYDLKSKGLNSVAMGEGELLKELVYKILH